MYRILIVAIAVRSTIDTFDLWLFEGMSPTRESVMRYVEVFTFPISEYRLSPFSDVRVRFDFGGFLPASSPSHAHLSSAESKAVETKENLTFSFKSIGFTCTHRKRKKKTRASPLSWILVP